VVIARESMDELTRYVIKNYSHLMTKIERLAYKNLIIREKAKNASSQEYAGRLIEKFITEDSRVKELLKNGSDAFLQSVGTRILQEHSGEVIINRCPRCHALARTSIAKQCPKCFFDWH
jgi:hypothetical protein